MKNIITLSFILLALFMYSSCYIQPIIDEKYQPLGTAVLTANGLLMVVYPEDRPDHINQNEYKILLKEDYELMYERLLPYLVQIKKVDNNFIVSVFDGDLLILTDWLCTEGRIDCWNYNAECNPDTIEINCD